MAAESVLRELKSRANSRKAVELQRFFKTGKGEYAEGDIFLGIAVPEIRKIAREYETLELTELAKLMASPLHEA